LARVRFGFALLLSMQPRNGEGEMLKKTFTAKLRKSRKKGGWTYVVWPESVKFF
jgi:hypothetical protein